MPTLREFEQWLTTSEAASRLGKSPQGIKWMLENQRLRGVRTKLGWLVDPADVEAAKQRNKRRIGSP
jgi:excisionase family DNA binding protein